MSVQSFIESSEILYNNGKYEEALCLACIAIDACSANQYPKKTTSERYKLFLKEHFSTICEFGFPGIMASKICIKITQPSKFLKPDENGYVTMEQIIYHVLRCGLVHTCNIENTIQFTDRTIIKDWDQEKFPIPKDIIHGLLESVKNYEFRQS